jgi:soluble cytochrome b562
VLSFSTSLDSLFKLVAEGRIKKREKAIQFFDELAKQSDRLVETWIKLRLTAGEIPSDRMSAKKAKKYFGAIDEWGHYQRATSAIIRDMYEDISRASGSQISHEEMEVMSTVAADVISQRQRLRVAYDTIVGHRDKLPEEAQIEKLRAGLDSLIDAVAKLKAEIAVLKAH